MKKNSFLWAALSMTAALVMTACSNDDNDMTEAPVAPSTSKTIPYTVTVSGDEATTRATVDSDNKTLKFAAGDKLYITGTDIKGVLDIESGVGSASGAKFSGTLTYSGSGSPSDGLSLTATLVSAQQTVGNQVSVNDAGAVTVKYPTAAYCTSVNDAVQKYSNLIGLSTYGAKTFSLSQQTAFLNFVITFDDGTTSGTELSAVVSNGSAICTANVTTTTENNNVVAKFVLPVASGITLTGPTVKMGDKNAISFIGATLSPKVYNVKRTQLNPNAISGKFTVNKSGEQVYFSKGNLRASKNIGPWSWSFAPNQLWYVGDASSNNQIDGDGSVSTLSDDLYVDLFGWSTTARHYGISNNTTNSSYSDKFVDWGSVDEVKDGIGTGWSSLESTEWRYLFKTRTTTSGIRYTKASIDGAYGIILLPDDWSTAYYTLNSKYLNDDCAGIGFAACNTITAANWTSKLEAHGAVFLRAAGQREGKTITMNNGRGYYWSCNEVNSESGIRLYFAGNEVSPDAGGGKHFGYSVRLVYRIGK